MSAAAGVFAILLLTASAVRPIDRLAWLAGCWQRRGETRVAEEQWMAPRGGTMVGMGRTTAGDQTVAWEHLRIEERDGRLFFIAHPSGQSEAVFEQTALGDSSVTFENPEHDFPQRITYQLLPDGSLIARVGAGIGEAAQTVEFPMERAPCD